MKSLRTQSQKGFTLIELLIVMVVLVILIAVGISYFSNAERKAENAKVQENLSNLRFAIGIWMQSNSLPRNVSSCDAIPFSGTSGDQDQIITQLKDVAIIDNSGLNMVCVTGSGSGWAVSIEVAHGITKNDISKYCVDGTGAVKSNSSHSVAGGTARCS